VKKVPIAVILVFFFVSFFSSTPLFAAFTYKKYTVRYDRGQDILCEPYSVKKNDWILKVFKKKGEISYQDFHEFLKIFRRINPHVKNVNRIRPGQQILIPLQKIALGSLPGQSSGTVTIPFVTLSNTPQNTDILSSEYVLRKGDCVSILISKNFGIYGSASYAKGIEMFKRLNPKISNLNRVYAGQRVYLPIRQKENKQHASMFGGERSPSLFSNSEKFPAPKLDPYFKGSNLSIAASALDAELLDKGVYYFPRNPQPDLKLDLSMFPVLVLPNKTRIMFSGKNIEKSPYDLISNTFWKNLKEIKLSPNASLDLIFNAIMSTMNLDEDLKTLRLSKDNIQINVKGKWIIPKKDDTDDTIQKICIFLIDGVDELTPEPIVRYLAQNDILIREFLYEKNKKNFFSHKPSMPLHHGFPVPVIDTLDMRSFVKNMMAVLECSYTQNVGITFPYAGIQVKAVSNLISTRDGIPVFVDFGDLYGDAINAIEKTGFRVIQLRHNDSPLASIPKLLAAAGKKFIENPKFLSAKRTEENNSSIVIPGFLIKSGPVSKTLLTDTKMPPELVHFFNQRDIKIVRIQHHKGSKMNLNP